MATSKLLSIRKVEEISGTNQWFCKGGVAIFPLARIESVLPIRESDHWVKLPMEKRRDTSLIHIACRTGLLDPLVGQPGRGGVPGAVETSSGSGSVLSPDLPGG